MDKNKNTPGSEQDKSVIEATVNIVTAYVSNPASRIDPKEIPDLIRSVAGVVKQIDDQAASTGLQCTAVSETESNRSSATLPPAKPVVPVAKSVFDTYLLCLECGEARKTLTRHLNTAHGLSAAAYRLRFGLPPDYPMICPEYAKERSSLARRPSQKTSKG